jgi:hypothetical protein
MAKVTAKDRKEHATLSGGRFPIKNKAQALSALKLRGHTGSDDERRKVINRAAKFAPEEAAKAREADAKRKKGGTKRKGCK